MLPEPPVRTSGLVLIVLAAILWGTTGLSSTLLQRLSPVAPLSVGFLRLAIAVPVMLLFALRRSPGSAPMVVQRSWRALLLFGLGVAGYNLSFFAAISRTSVTVATLLALCTAPLFVALLARLFLHERLTPRTMAAMGLALAGTLLLVGGQASDLGVAGSDPVGNLLALLAGFSYAVYSLVGRAKAQEYPPPVVVSLAFAVGALLLAPLALGAGLQFPGQPVGWVILVYLGVGATAIPYLLYIVGLRTVSATTASVATLMEPLTAALLAATLLGERLTPLAWGGALLLLASLALLVWAQQE